LCCNEHSHIHYRAAVGGIAVDRIDSAAADIATDMTDMGVVGTGILLLAVVHQVAGRKAIAAVAELAIAVADRAEAMRPV
jgi:hypothetical protein